MRAFSDRRPPQASHEPDASPVSTIKLMRADLLVVAVSASKPTVPPFARSIYHFAANCLLLLLTPWSTSPQPLQSCTSYPAS